MGTTVNSGICCCCASQPNIIIPSNNYVGPVGIPAPIGLGFGSVQYGCCTNCVGGSIGCCNSGIDGCCAPDPFTPKLGQVGCGKCCGCCASNIPTYSNTFAPNPVVSDTGILIIPPQAENIQYVYQQGPPTIIPSISQAPMAVVQTIQSPSVFPPPPLIRPQINVTAPIFTARQPLALSTNQIQPIFAMSNVGSRNLSHSPIMMPSTLPAIVHSNQFKVMASPLAQLTTSIITSGKGQRIQSNNTNVPLTKTMSIILPK